MLARLGDGSTMPVADMDSGPGAASTSVATGDSVIAGSRSRYSKMRANSAFDVCRSSATRMRAISGNRRRACTVVNATITPAEMSALPPVMSRPATR